jgi:hypothetical protein
MWLGKGTVTCNAGAIWHLARALRAPLSEELRSAQLHMPETHLWIQEHEIRLHLGREHNTVLAMSLHTPRKNIKNSNIVAREQTENITAKPVLKKLAPCNPRLSVAPEIRGPNVKHIWPPLPTAIHCYWLHCCVGCVRKSPARLPQITVTVL